MSQATTHDRDAADPAAVAQALDAYLSGTGSADERDIALEAVLLSEGVLSPDDAVELLQIVQDGPEIRGVCVVLEGCTTMLSISRTGVVHACSVA